jgi:hypothetical protein
VPAALMPLSFPCLHEPFNTCVTCTNAWFSCPFTPCTGPTEAPPAQAIGAALNSRTVILGLPTPLPQCGPR